MTGRVELVVLVQIGDHMLCWDTNLQNADRAIALASGRCCSFSVSVGSMVAALADNVRADERRWVGALDGISRGSDACRREKRDGEDNPPVTCELECCVVGRLSGWDRSSS